MVYLEKCFEIMNIVEATSDLNIFEKTHPKDSKNEHDEEKQKTDVQESREWHDQRKEEGSDTFGSFDKTEHSSNFCYSDNSEKSGGDKVFFYKVT